MIFLDLGYQPFANEYLKNKFQKEKKYRLLIDFNKKNKIISIKKKFLSEKIFKNNYPYRSSISKTMRKSFKNLSIIIKKKFKKKKILEIGCNDGVFLENFNRKNTLGIEPCKNIAKLSKAKNISVISDYWTKKLSRDIKKKFGKFDLIFSANTITHIKNLDEVFSAVNHVLDEDGVFIIQDPSLLELIKNNAYDQFYNEHIYVFSYLSLSSILKNHDFEIFHIENISDHGGSLRYYIKKKNSNFKITKSVKDQKKLEINFGLQNFSTYKKFSSNVKYSREKLIKLFNKIKSKNQKIIGYGATAKAVTVLNYCKINNDLINYFVDTTPEKQGKFMPGVKIPVIKYSKLSRKKVDYAFLGAWNFKSEIIKKEKSFLSNKGKFITHIPFPKIVT